MQELQAKIQTIVKDLFGEEVEIELTRPEEQFGDYSTNVAMQLAGEAKNNPREVAIHLASELKKNGIDCEVAGPGFINIKLSDEQLAKLFNSSLDLPKPLEGQEILVEFGDPNPFKEMHIGHLYSYIVGDSISKLFESAGADVKRLSYHGDVGLHVAKAVWGMKNSGGTDDIGKSYALGAKAYQEDPAAKAEIDEINEQIYAKSNPEINKLYDEGKKKSFEDFDETLELLQIKTDRRYLESETAGIGKKYVEENVGKVFEESDGAIVFKGEKVGLHTRVFLTSQKLPTYESKDLGLAELKGKDYPNAKRSIVITANEQAEYFKVMLAALSEISPELAQMTTHITHGFLSLTTGKMSSRTGEVYPAMKLLLETKDEVHEQYKDSPVKKPVTLGAVKYTFLKHGLGADIVVDVKESIGLEGNSGPYLQYAHARASSILGKAESKQLTFDNFEPGERSLARKVSEYPEVIAKAIDELMPHHICTYLYELAQTFNRFYEDNRVIGDDRESERLSMVNKYAQVLEHGLGLLNIEAPEKM